MCTQSVLKIFISTHNIFLSQKDWNFKPPNRLVPQRFPVARTKTIDPKRERSEIHPSHQRGPGRGSRETSGASIGGI